MHWSLIAALWPLGVAIGGLVAICLWVYLTRDTGVRASGQRSGRTTHQAALAHANAIGDRTRAILAGQEAMERVCDHGYPALADGRCAAELVSATNLVQRTGIDEARVAALSHRLIEQSIRAVYADIEARQVRQLAQTAWATWQA